VPTGNFGNIFAGYIARRMGLPIETLILATNQNDILHRFFTTGRYERGELYFSHSPAMDIQVASNFERYLYFEFGQAPEKVKEFLTDFSSSGFATSNFNTLNLDGAFTSGRVSDEDTVGTIARIFEESGYLLDPHTAVGIDIGLAKWQPQVPLVCMATAHPAKFDDVIRQAIPGIEVSHPTLEVLKGLPERKTLLEGKVDAIKGFISSFNGNQSS
jgi:threonine synthase